MFSLIITIVSIALVVALVAATMYHGGDTLSQGRNSATAAEYVNGAHQIASAITILKAQNGAEVTSVTELVTKGALRSLPTALASASLHALGQDEAPFRFVSSGESLTFETCQAIEAMAGRVAPTVQDGAFPSHIEYAKFQAYGCLQGEGLGFYFKI